MATTNVDGLTKNGDPFACEPGRRSKLRILVTGGAGFVGSHLVGALLAQGHEVICLDNFFSGSKDNIREYINNPNFEYMRHDVTKEFLVEVDRIYHLACPAAPGHYQFNAIKTLKTNVLGSLNVLGCAKRTRARVLLASTSEVYGDPEVHPQVESYFGNVNTIGIRSCYDEGKRAAEALFMDYHRQHNVDIRIARIFNTYGPRMFFGDGRVVSNFIVQCLNSQPITIYGQGAQTRSFCYVDDLVKGLIALMESDCHEVCNLGNPREFTVLQLAEMVKKQMSSPVEIVYKPLPSDDPKRRQPDITRARKNLGWEPVIPLEEGLQKTIEDFTRRKEAADVEAENCRA